MTSSGTASNPVTELSVSGTVPQGTGIAPLNQTGDGVVAKLLPQDRQASTIDADGTALTGMSFDPTAHTWSGSVAVSDLSAADTVGKGASYVFRTRLTTTSDGNSEYSFSSPMKADVVAPAFGAGSLKFDQDARTVSGAVLSGDKAAHAGALAEQGDAVTVTWPAGSTPTTSTGTTDANGKFIIAIPRGVLLRGNARLTVGDHPAADVPTTTGTGSPNVSPISTLDVTAETVSSLPLTGGTQPWWKQPWFYALLAAVGIALTDVILRRRSCVR